MVFVVRISVDIKAISFVLFCSVISKLTHETKTDNVCIYFESKEMSVIERARLESSFAF